MKAAICRMLGTLADVRLEEVAAPVLVPGSVRIRIALAAANFPDLLMPQGKYQVRPQLPFAIGLECAGVVAEIADGIRDIGVGDRVMAYAGYGCFAEEVVVRAEQVYQMPAGMPFEIGAGFAVAYGTAYHALIDRGELAAGETVAILGAAGGLGLSAIEIAKAIGARAIAVASTPEKLEICRSHGADAILLSGAEGLKQGLLQLSGGEGVHVVYDTVGGGLTLAALRALRPFGRHLIVGYASGEIPQIPANYVLLKQVSVVGVSFRQCAQNTPSVAQAGLRALVAMWKAGKLKPHVADVHSFERFHDAVHALSSRSAVGKHVVRIADM